MKCKMCPDITLLKTCKSQEGGKKTKAVLELTNDKYDHMVNI